MMTIYPAINYLAYSGQLTNAVWGSPGVALNDVTAQVVSPPTGHSTRMMAINNGAGYLQFVIQGDVPCYLPDSQYTLTAWIYPETWTEEMGLTLVDSTNTGVTVSFNPADVSIGATASLVTPTINPGAPWGSPTCSVAELSGGWFAVTVSGITSATPNLVLSVLLGAAETLGSLGSSIQVGGLALYYGNDTSYQDTTSTNPGSSLQLFNFPLHSVSSRYPGNGLTVQMGGSYTFSTKPSGPPQRMFTLRFMGMKWYWNADGSLDIYTNQPQNMGALDAFYMGAQLWQPFRYLHPVYGLLIVRFAKPLELPETHQGSPNDVLMTLSIELIEQP
jgi:hypothetical protein